MPGYFIKRIIMIIPTVMAVLLVLFLLLTLLPGTNVQTMVRYDTPTETGGLISQYLTYCWRLFTRLDFGIDNATNQSLRGELLIRFANTLRMTGVCLLITLLLGVPAGVCSALHRGSWQDTLISGITLVLSATPAFCLALAAALIFGLELGWFQLSMASPWDYILPYGVLSLNGLASVTRMARSGMLETLDQDYMTAIRALGVPRRSLIWKHGLKNALIPVISVLSSLAGFLLCGAIVVERFFGLRGLGYYITQAIGMRMTSTILACVVLICFTMCVLSILTDGLLVLVDPSMRQNLNWRSSGSLRRRNRRSGHED